jgi:CRP/FNR family transcriptional regulator, cyclic AMP receptor protein
MPLKPAVIDVRALVDALPESLAQLARRGLARPYPKQAILIAEGDCGDTIFIILAGRLRVYSSNLAQDREITYGTYGPGEYVGELSLDGGPRSASVVAVEPSICAVVTRSTLESFIAERPAFAFELLAKVIGRARAATLSARQMALNDVYGRIKLLLESMDQTTTADGLASVERLTHRDIGARVGCSREMVSRIMKDLETGGYVEVESSRLRLLRSLPPRW